MISRRSLALLPFASALAGRWDDSRFPDWDQKFIDRLLTDSPWARPRSGTAVQDLSEKRMISSRWTQLGMDLPPLPGGSGRSRAPRAAGGADNRPLMLRIGVDLTIRWASALPIRRAYALQEFGRDRLHADKARAMLAEDPRDVIIELAGIPHALATPELERDLSKARLNVPARRPVQPAAVELPTMGVQVTARLTFPRIERLAPDADSMRFTAESGSLHIAAEFKPRNMVYEGRLEV